MSGNQRAAATLATIIIVALLAFLVRPAFDGYHLGFNSATDNTSLTELGLQWGKYRPPAAAAPATSSTGSTGATGSTVPTEECTANPAVCP